MSASNEAGMIALGAGGLDVRETMRHVKAVRHRRCLDGAGRKGRTAAPALIGSRHDEDDLVTGRDQRVK